MREHEISDIPDPDPLRQDANTTSTTSAADSMAPTADETWQRWCWLRHWEFWLALALGAFLRLWQLGTSQFLDDQAGMYTLARQGILHHAIPLTSIPASIGTLNPPLSVYLLLPFAAFTASPIPAIVTLALWNVLGVVLCYIFGLRYFGRHVAAVGTLLFATNAAVLNYSRFLWPPNYLPTLLVLWALTLYMGAVRGERRWLAGNLLLLGLAVLLHPTAVLLAPVTLAGVLLAPRFPHPRAYVVAAIGLLLLLVPTLIFEAASRGFDLRPLAHYALHGGHFDGQIFRVFLGALSGAGTGDLGPQAPYAASGAWFQAIAWATALLIVAGWLVLTVRIVAPAVALWRGQEVAPSRMLDRLKTWAIAVWRGLRADRVWRAHFLVWLWVTLPLVALLHHSSDLFVHYLLVIYPALFLVGGFGVDWLITRSAARAGMSMPLRRAAPALALSVVALVVAGQGLRYYLYPASIASGNFQAYVSYGYPPDELLALDDQLTTLQRQQGATATYIVTPDATRYRLPEQYLLAADRADRVAFPASCLVVPAPDEGAALVVSLAPGSPAAALLAALPNAHAVAHIPLAGGDPLTMYRVAGAPPALADETAVAGVAYLNGSGNGLRLDAVSLATPGMLWLRGTILGAPPAGLGSPFYRIQLQMSGGATSTTSTRVDCAPTRLHAGETLFTWMSVPMQSSLTGAELANGSALQVSAGTQALNEFSLGPVHFLSDRTGGVPLQASTLATMP